MLHFDMTVHQVVRHPLFDPVTFPVCILQSYVYLYTFDIVDMTLSHMATLPNPPHSLNDFAQTPGSVQIGRTNNHSLTSILTGSLGAAAYGDDSVEQVNRGLANGAGASVSQQPGQMIRMNLPCVDLNTIVFEKDKPYFYIINETHVEKYAY